VTAAGTPAPIRQERGLVDVDLRGRRALVTGGASGIGLACALRLAAAGAEVTVADREGDHLDEAAAAAGASTWAVDLDDTETLAKATVDVDILVNNAGLQRLAPVHEFDPAQFSTMLRVMLEAPFLLTRAALPGMYRRRYGRVVHMSSVHGQLASAYKVAYVTAKHGLEGLSKVVALEGASHGVTSNTIRPSYVRTPLVEGQVAEQAALHSMGEDAVLHDVLLTRPAIKRLLEPYEVAEVVAFLSSPAASFITGTSLCIDGGWSAS
jgi:3-hydroxybutyrate dehydrogenase